MTRKQQTTPARRCRKQTLKKLGTLLDRAAQQHMDGSDNNNSSSSKFDKAPIPMVVLTEQQYQQIEKYCVLVCLREKFPYDKREHCHLPAYDILYRGAEFSSTGPASAIIVELHSVTSLSSSHPFYKESIQLLGNEQSSSSSSSSAPAGKGVLLVLGKKSFPLHRQQHQQQQEPQDGAAFTEAFLAQVRHLKSNIITQDGDNTKHHGSVGEYYGYGTKASTGKTGSDDLSSINQYAFKTHLSKADKEVLGDLSVDDCRQLNKYHQSKVVQALDEGYDCLASLFQLQNTVGRSFVPAGFAINESLVQKLCGANPALGKHISLLGKTKSCSAFINHNAETKRKHTEADSAYTMIYVPLQDWLAPGMTSPTAFNFVLNEEETIRIPLEVGVCIYFHGFFLVHNQERSPSTDNNNNSLLNISCYGNKRLYTHARKTFVRTQEHKEKQQQQKLEMSRHQKKKRAKQRRKAHQKEHKR